MYQSELLAILNALQWTETTHYKRIGLFTDSQSSLQALENIMSQDYLINEIIKLLQSTDKTYYFKWVRGHAGLMGNELADKLAKEATLQSSTALKIFFPFPASYIKWANKS